MRVRFPFSILLTAALFLWLTPTQSATPPKAGTSCSRLGVTKTYLGKKFTCLKSGKTLVWKKNVTSSQASPSPSATPSATPSVIPTPTSSPTPSITISATPTPTTSPTVFITPTSKPRSISELDPSTAWYFAWKSMEDYRIKNQPIEVRYKVVQSENFDRQTPAVIMDGLKAASAFWSDFWKPENQILLILGTEKDLPFWKQELDKLFDSRWHKSRSELYDNLLSSFQRFGSRTNSAGASWFANTPNMIFPYGSALSAKDISENNWQTTPHEYTHLVQGTMSYSFNLYGMGTQWMSEGQAELVGLFLTKQSASDYAEYRSLRLRNNFQNPSVSRVITAQQIYDAINDGSPQLVYDAHYSFGMAAMEALVAIHGHGAILKYFEKIKSGVWWPNAFKDVFGQSHSDFLKELTPYLENLRTHLTSNASPSSAPSPRG